ncbi:hypothetical protein Fmac_016129 [Flemingia macrophylla]|uniref:Uncharacterized protein n=1 Tax=Flemingia macrophylla TaxID=520843 RepID=A0ABD1MGI8_9FABA
MQIRRDVTPSLFPLSFSLHNSYLHTHYSSCFSPFPNPNSLFFCSLLCSLHSPLSSTTFLPSPTPPTFAPPFTSFALAEQLVIQINSFQVILNSTVSLDPFLSGVSGLSQAHQLPLGSSLNHTVLDSLEPRHWALDSLVLGARITMALALSARVAGLLLPLCNFHLLPPIFSPWFISDLILFISMILPVPRDISILHDFS